ncbi:MAG: YceI family protein, partial [Pseudomonadota bacterium]
LAELPAGSMIDRTISPQINLHGAVLLKDVQVRISKLSDSELLVQNTAPILIDATLFGMDAGIETLRELAGLDVISFAVPVNFHLRFRAGD